MQEDQAPPLKKAYSVPTLRVYGSIEELTQAANAGTKLDTRGPFLDPRSH